jgi:hypothetical protein
VGLNGVALALAFTFYIQAYLSIPSIKDDCASRRFVADAMWGPDRLGRWFLFAGALALIAVALPGIIASLRNFRRGRTLPLLRSGREFDGWSEESVLGVVWAQALLMAVSFVIWAVFTVYLLIAAPDSTPEGVQRDWHNFELKCLQPDQVAPPPKAPG